MIALADRMLSSGNAGTLATLFSAQGSTYRSLGSMMVSMPGMHAGGVSGGCLEEFVAREGERLTRHRPTALLKFSTRPDSDDDVPVLGCGGSIEILVERLALDHLTWLRTLAAACGADESSVVTCRISGPHESMTVSRSWLNASGRSATCSPELARIGRDVARSGMSRNIDLGRSDRALMQFVPPLTRLLIVGAGDDAQPLCDLGCSLGWHVTVADRRARLATTSRFPRADDVVAGDWDDIISAVLFTARTAVVLMTHSLQDDARVLSLLDERSCNYLGALGPAQRRRWLIEEVGARGTPLSAASVARLRGPVGLDLGDRSATGIAVAVTAEILASINHREARSLTTHATEGAIEAPPRSCYA
jgi:xanthine dehydrogenase accessory factor